MRDPTARTEYLLVDCPGCDEETIVLSETETGTTSWSPEECPDCGRTFTGDEAYQAVDPREEFGPDREERD